MLGVGVGNQELEVRHYSVCRILSYSFLSYPIPPYAILFYILTPLFTSAKLMLFRENAIDFNKV